MLDMLVFSNMDIENIWGDVCVGVVGLVLIRDWIRWYGGTDIGGEGR